MALATALPPIDRSSHARAPEAAARGGRLSRWVRQLGLTSRILAVNVMALALLAGSLFYLDSLRKQLLEERFKLARAQVEIAADAVALTQPRDRGRLLATIGSDQHMRLRLYGRGGTPALDSFALAAPSFTLIDPDSEPWLMHAARAIDRLVDLLVGAAPVETYREPARDESAAWPEVAAAREAGGTVVRLRYAPDRTPVINAAALVPGGGEVLLATQNPRDITELVREARQTLAIIVAVAFMLSVQLSLYLARTIVQPLRSLVRAAVRVRLGREREVVVPRLPERRDEIGMLARAVSDMTAALRHRIDAVESFAADVSHEIKNPLASLRSALEALGKVDDPALRARLTSIATHDLHRIDRLISEIADASRIDAELSRARFAPVDLATMARRLASERRWRGNEGEGGVTVIAEGEPGTTVLGVAARLERVIENLVDNAVSFSPPGGRVSIDVRRLGRRVELAVSDEGPGVPPEQRDKVFQRFHSVRPAEEDFGAHSGLGLAIARAIVEAHDGTLTIRDRPDRHQGACVVMDLPAA